MQVDEGGGGSRERRGWGVMATEWRVGATEGLSVFDGRGGSQMRDLRSKGFPEMGRNVLSLAGLHENNVPRPRADLGVDRARDPLATRFASTAL